jgi:4-hydroxy-2-oxoheptanedioate aldolase
MATLREKLNANVTIGTWLQIGSSQTAEIMGQVGLDWVILDTQHGGMSESDLLPIIQALSSTGTPALVRVNWLDPALIMRAGDLGADGVVIPMVNTPEDAELAVRSIRYPPRGMRSFGPLRNYFIGGETRETLCLCMIETVEALANVEKIAAVPGVDGLLVGPADLALSMGLQFTGPMAADVLDGIEKVASVCKRNGLIAASVGIGAANVAEQVRRGVTFITTGADSMFMRQAAMVEVQQVRKALGLEAKS